MSKIPEKNSCECGENPILTCSCGQLFWRENQLLKQCDLKYENDSKQVFICNRCGQDLYLDYEKKKQEIRDTLNLIYNDISSKKYKKVSRVKKLNQFNMLEKRLNKGRKVPINKASFMVAKQISKESNYFGLNTHEFLPCHDGGVLVYLYGDKKDCKFTIHTNCKIELQLLNKK